MKLQFALSVGLLTTLGLVIDSAQAEPALAGAFNVTFYDEPNLTTSNTWCYEFTTTKGVLGYPVSGTWIVPSYNGTNGGWSGDWYQVGDEIIMDSVANGTFALAYKGRLINATRIEGRFSQFDLTGKTDYAGTFLGVKIAGSCPASDGTATTGNPVK